jgi:hypothetical protein
MESSSCDAENPEGLTKLVRPLGPEEIPLDCKKQDREKQGIRYRSVPQAVNMILDGNDSTDDCHRCNQAHHSQQAQFDQRHPIKLSAKLNLFLSAGFRPRAWYGRLKAFPFQGLA